MKRTFIITGVMLIALAFSQTVYKTGDSRLSPRLLNYQGYLTDTLDNPVTNPSVSMTFAIFDAASAGNQKWSEIQSSVAIDKGIFNVLLGSVTPIPDSVFVNSTSRYLELTVAGQVLSPRTRIVSVAYAYTSTYSDTAQYAKNATADNDWTFRITDTADTTLQMGGRWGLARPGNTLYGTADSTHVNFGVACTTGTSGLNSTYCTVSGGYQNVASGLWSSTVSGGRQNSATNAYATVAGGYHGVAGGYSSTVSGGYENTTSGYYATVGGGRLNSANNESAVVGGGYADSVNAFYGGILSGFSNLAGDDAAGDTAAVVAGGWNNSATGDYSYIGGGRLNTSSGAYATVCGGEQQSASGNWSLISGGRSNTAFFDYATVAGGYTNAARSEYGFIGGGYMNQSGISAGDTAAFVGGGRQNRAGEMYATVAGGYLDTVMAYAGGVFSGWDNKAGDAASDTAAFVGGGRQNSALAKYATVAGGVSNTANGYCAFVGGGYLDTVIAPYGGITSGWDNKAGGGMYDTAAFVGGGNGNTASAKYATVAGGFHNSANSECASVGGGNNNTASLRATVGGGYNNTASSSYAVIPGGAYITVSGTASFGFGYGSAADTVKVTGSYDVVFGDGGAYNYQFGINRETPTNPLHIGTNNTNGNGAYLSTGGVWTNGSSRYYKEDFQPLDGIAILSKVAELDITKWKFKGSQERHISPVAQDFYQAFGCGTGNVEDDSTHIAAMDMAGVALRSIQELTRLVRSQQTLMFEQQKKIEELEKKIAAMQ